MSNGWTLIFHSHAFIGPRPFGDEPSWLHYDEPDLPYKLYEIAQEYLLRARLHALATGRQVDTKSSSAISASFYGDLWRQYRNTGSHGKQAKFRPQSLVYSSWRDELVKRALIRDFKAFSCTICGTEGAAKDALLRDWGGDGAYRVLGRRLDCPSCGNRIASVP